SVANTAPLSIGTPYFTNSAGQAISMPAPAGTTLINVGWTTNLNANCTYAGFTANGNGTTSHYVTRSPLSNGFSETATIACTDVTNGANSNSRSVSISVANQPPVITGIADYLGGSIE